jgi:hypothetical protein
MMQRLRRVRDVYNGDLVLPFAEETEPAVANMILMGIDQKAGRLASVSPQMWFPPDRPGAKTSEEKAIERRNAVFSWWEDNEMPDVLTQRARHLLAYGRSVVMMWPDVGRYLPQWKVRNPLGVFASEELEAPMRPTDIVVAHNKPFAWLRQHFPDVAFRANPQGDLSDFAQIVLLEYSDADDLALVFGGVDVTWEPGMHTLQWETDTWGGTVEDLWRVPNRTGMCLGIIATRPVLDREQGEFDQIIGMYGAQAKLTALELDAIERDIYPDVYLVSRPNEVAKFVYGPVDGRSGEVNIITGGDIQTTHEQPGWMTSPMVDRLERAQRLTSGIPAEFGGESTQNVRTGRRGDAILSAIIDFPLAEGQRAFAKSIRAENELAIHIAKAWWGDTKRSYHFVEGRQGKSGDYVPNTLFDGPLYHKVSYPVAGADMNNLIVGIGQRLGLGTLSRRSAAELDPLVEDPEFEIDRITSEALEQALLASVQQAAAGGMLSPRVVGRIVQLVRSGQDELATAIEKALAEEQALREAEAPAEPGAQAAMGQMAAEAAGSPQALPTVAEPGQGLQNLQSLVRNLRQTGTRGAGREVLGGAA